MLVSYVYVPLCAILLHFSALLHYYRNLHVLDAAVGTVARSLDSGHDRPVHCIALPSPSKHVQVKELVVWKYVLSILLVLRYVSPVDTDNFYPICSTTVIHSASMIFFVHLNTIFIIIHSCLWTPTTSLPQSPLIT